MVRAATTEEALRELSGRDPVMAALIADHGPPDLKRSSRGESRFSYLARSILYQQLAGKAAAAIHGRFVAALNGRVTAEAVLATDPQVLRACGLSGSKTAAIVDLAEKVAGGQVSLDRIGRLSDEDVIAHLIQVKGIGRWTAEMFLMWCLGRPDVWPVDDFGVRAGFARAWGLPEPPRPKDLRPLGEPFRPYRSLVAWYCWRAADNAPPTPDSRPDLPPPRAAGRSPRSKQDRE